MKKIVMFTVLTIAGIFNTMNAQKLELMTSNKKGWHKIGETTVNFKKESDEIIVLGADRFTSIRFKVTDAPVYVTSLEVFFESGDTQIIKVGYPIKLNGESKTIDLNGGNRNLKKIVMVYKTLPNHKDEKAHVEVWGLKNKYSRK